MTKLFSNPRFLTIYSAVVTLAFAIVVLTGFPESRQKQSFDEITVRRINVVEPDGTLRMVISNKAAFPGVIIKGKETPHPDRTSAGMLFFNDEGTENGGLIFGGMKDKDGQPHSYGHLSFDRYNQDQTLTLDANQDGGHERTGIAVNDLPDWPINDLFTMPRDQWPKYLQSHGPGHSRIFLGRNDDKSASLTLKDPDGRPRMVLKVAADGSPVIQLLDQNGKVPSKFPARAGKKKGSGLAGFGSPASTLLQINGLRILRGCRAMRK